VAAAPLAGGGERKPATLVRVRSLRFAERLLHNFWVLSGSFKKIL
jgi:hypothetical protein